MEDRKPIFYEQLLQANTQIERLKSSIKSQKNQVALLAYNNLLPAEASRKLKHFYKIIMQSYLDFEALNEINENCSFNTIATQKKFVITKLYNAAMESEYHINQFRTELKARYKFETHEYKRINTMLKRFEQTCTQQPLQIIKNIFQCDIIMPHIGDKFNNETMQEIYTFSTQIDYYKGCRKELGTFVLDIQTPAIKDNLSDKIIFKANIVSQNIKLDDKFYKFTIVK